MSVLGVRFKRGSADSLKNLHPGYFALVMATGIVAIASHLHHVPFLPNLLFWLNLAFIFILSAATLLRITRYPGAFVADISSHGRGMGFFTTVAGLGVFGSELIIQMNSIPFATILWILASALWILIMYGVLTALTITKEKPALEDGLNGAWLVSIVATQSISILTVLMLHPEQSESTRQGLMFVALVLWLGGSSLYMWVMTLIFYRYTFLRMSPADLTPPYWINMGAMAISTLAGATLFQHASLSPVVHDIRFFVEGVTLFFWAVATWWIPMLVVLGIWRYVVRGVPFSYDPLYWGGVFPLGMYSVCTFKLAEVTETTFLMPISHTFMIISVIAWLAAFTGLLDSRLHRNTS